MADYIVKIPHKGIDYYLLWSTNTDSPVTYGASLAAYKKYYKDQYGEKGTLDLCERLERVEKKEFHLIYIIMLKN